MVHRDKALEAGGRWDAALEGDTLQVEAAGFQSNMVVSAAFAKYFD